MPPLVSLAKKVRDSSPNSRGARCGEHHLARGERRRQFGEMCSTRAPTNAR